MKPSKERPETDPRKWVENLLRYAPRTLRQLIEERPVWCSERSLRHALHDLEYAGRVRLGWDRMYRRG